MSRYRQIDVLWMQTVPVSFSGTGSYDEKRRRRGKNKGRKGRMRSRRRVAWTRVQWFRLQILVSSV